MGMHPESDGVTGDINMNEHWHFHQASGQVYILFVEDPARFIYKISVGHGISLILTHIANDTAGDVIAHQCVSLRIRTFPIS